MNRFLGRAAIVTGGASGIGAAAARQLQSEGAQVAVVDIDDERGLAMETDRDGDSGALFYQHCDVRSLVDWQKLVNNVIDRCGRLDIVHNNAAGRYGLKPTHELTEQDWDYQIDLTVKQIFLCVKACITHLVASNGVIINTSSVHALMGFPQQAPYDAGKGAVRSLTRQLAAEYGPHVRVNSVAPGAIQTPAWDGVSDAERRWYVSQTPASRLGTPDDVAAAVCFLASDEASFITGAELVVDGGWSITKNRLAEAR